MVWLFPKHRYLCELKEDDDACKKAQQTGAFYLFHNLAPLLQKSEHQYLAPQHSLLGKPKVDQPVATEQNSVHVKSLRRILQLWSSSFFQMLWPINHLVYKRNCPVGYFLVMVWASRLLSGQEPAYQCRIYRFSPWVRKIPWRRAWQPTPVFLPGESHGQRSLAGYSP